MENEFEDFIEYDDIDDDFFLQDNYYYDNDSSFDSTINDYEYLDYEYSKFDRNEEDNYYNEDLNSDYDNIENRKTNNRNKLIKIIIAIIFILLIIWVVNLSFKSANKKVEEPEEVKVIKTNNIDYEEMFLKTRNAALRYYTEEEIADSTDCEKSLKLLKALEYIKTDSDSFNLDKSSIKLTKEDNTDNYKIIITLVHKDEQKTRTYEVSNYSYCVDTYLCEKQEILGLEDEKDDSETPPEEKEMEKPNKKETILSAWGLWSNYERTSCNTKSITCKINDSNCLEEVKLYERKEKIDTYNKIYTNSRMSFSLVSKDDEIICNKYDYIKIDGQFFRIEKNSQFTVLGAINKSTKSNYFNWRYDGRNSYTTPPSDSINTRYIYVGPDYSDCSNTCKNNLKYYYDKYTFTKVINISNDPKLDCNEHIPKVIANYAISRQNINISRTENLYGTVCYKSTRYREIIEK